MTKPSSITCLSIFVFSLTISGCELAPNTAKEEAITPGRENGLSAFI